MGKSSRAKRIRRFEKTEQQDVVKESIDVDSNECVQVIEEPSVTKDSDIITDVVPVIAQPINQPKPSPTYNPNSASGLLNSILTTLLTQEYNRLQQQLINIKTQLDEQKSIVGQMTEEKLDKNNEDILDC